LTLEVTREGGAWDRHVYRSTGRPRTSLPHDRYAGRVERIQSHIIRGDIYQANLAQRFETAVQGDAQASFARLAAQASASRAAFVQWGATAVLSVSPELFLRVDADGGVETRPIKGTRPRSPDPILDRALAHELSTADKDRAELMMIVDLERNDLGRVCLPGSVCVPRSVALRSLAAVHHLEACVSGRLRDPGGLRALLLATFPGGSISGAPKRRAIEILQEVEPVRRGFFTGILLWCGDDGTIDSSILIRTIVVDRDSASIGAGGGIVAESDPIAEWRESCDKARLLTRLLGFDPEEAE
jgi:para-aminobenzoate synthetase component 1